MEIFKLWRFELERSNCITVLIKDTDKLETNVVMSAQNEQIPIQNY